MSVARVIAGSSKKALSPTNLTSTLSGDGYTITLNWTNPVSSLYDQIQVERSVDGGGYSLVATLANGTTTYSEAPGYSLDVTYRIRCTKAAGVASDYVVATTRRTLPAAPSINSFGASGNNGTMVLDANSPGHAKISRFDVALSTNGGSSWAATVDTGADPDHVFSGVTPHGGTAAARVRTVDTLSQVSAWVQSSNAPIVNDTSGPVVPTPGVSANGRGVDLTWTALSDASAIIESGLQIDTGGGFYTLATWPNGAGRTQTVYFSEVDRGKLVYFRVYGLDAYGNYGYSPTAQFQTAPKGTFYAFPIESATWETAGTPSWRVDTDDVVSGFFDGTYGTQYGAWFYNTAIADLCKGHVPNLMTLIMIRDGSSGSTGNNVIQQHTNATKPGGAVTYTGTTDNGPQLAGSNAIAEHWLPGGWYSSLATGVGKGIGTLDSGSYRRLQGRAKNIYSGLVTIYFTD